MLGAGPVLAASSPPTFDDVLAAPDDLQLNLDYALAEAAAGNLLSASTTLERLLLIRPDWHSARLLYAIMLYRLGDLRGAEVQLKQLDAAPLSGAQAAEVRRYHRLTARGPQTGEFSGQIAAGLSYEGDAYGALFTQFDVPVGAKSQAGTSGALSGRLDGSVKVGAGGRLSAYGSLVGYNKSSLSGPNDELQFVEGRTGLFNGGRNGTWRVGGVLRHYRLFGEPYLNEYGLQADASARLSPLTSLTGSAEAVRQNYDEPLVDARRAALGGTHDGWRYDLNVGLSYRTSPRSVVAASVGYETKTAGYDPFAYVAPHVQASYSLQLPRRSYFSLSGQVRWVDYDGRDPVFLSNIARKDTRMGLRAEAGAPLSAFTAAGSTGDVRDEVQIQGAVTYNRRNSVYPVADYDSLGGHVLLVWRFGGRK